MAYRLEPDQRRFIVRETAISLVLGGLLPAATMYFLLGPFPMSVWSGDGFAAFLMKNSFGMGTVMTLIMSLVVRARVAKGSAPALGWSRDEQPLLGLAPRPLLLRAILFGSFAALTLGIGSVSMLTFAGLETIDRLPFALVIAGQSVLIAAALTPLILLAAMSDGRTGPGKRIA